MDSLSLLAYWRDRPESVDDCARRLVGFLSEIGNQSSLFERWLTWRAPIQELGPRTSLDDIRTLLAASVARTDLDEPIPELGYRAGMWNGALAARDAATLALTCGLAANDPDLSNSVRFQLPPGLSYEADRAVIEGVFAGAVRHWDPEWAWVDTELRDLQEDHRRSFGVLTFVGDGVLSLHTEAVRAMGGSVASTGTGLEIRIDPAEVATVAVRLRELVAGN